MNTSWPVMFLDTPFALLDKCSNLSSSNQVFCNLANTLGFLSAYIFPIFALFGIPGNIIAAVIFLRSKNLTRQKFYLAVLCLLDALNVFWTGFMWMFVAKGLPWASNGRFYFFIINENEFLCRFYRFSGTLTSTLAANFLLLPTVDRMLSIAMPIRFNKGYLRTAKIVTLGYVVITIAANLPFYFWSGIRYSNHVTYYLAFCSTTTYLARSWVPAVARLRYLFYYIGVIPAFLIMLANVILTGLIVKAHRRRTQLRNAQSVKSKITLNQISPSLVILLISSIYMVITLVFCICTLLSVLLSSSMENYSFWLSVIYDILDISVMFFLFHESVNILIFLWRMADFREQFVKMFGLKKFVTTKSTTSVKEMNVT